MVGIIWIEFGDLLYFETLTMQIVKRESIQELGLQGESWRSMDARVREVFFHLAVMKFGYSGAAVARFLGVTTLLENRMARAKGVTDSDHYTE